MTNENTLNKANSMTFKIRMSFLFMNTLLGKFFSQKFANLAYAAFNCFSNLMLLLQQASGTFDLEASIILNCNVNGKLLLFVRH